MNRLILCSICLFLFFNLTGQQSVVSPEDSSAYKEIIQSYLKESGNHAIIYSGKEQMKYPAYIIGHPYLIKPEYETGNLFYDGIFYPDVKMRLDKYKDELIVLSPDNQHHIIVSSDKLGYADLYSYHIIYHSSDGLAGSPAAGYYLKLYDGKYTVLEKQSSEYREDIKDLKVEASFIHATRYYIKTNNRYHIIRSKGSVLRVFKDKKRELNQFIRQNKLDFRLFPEEAIVAIIQEYERLED